MSFGEKLVYKLGSSVPEDKKEDLKKKADELFEENCSLTSLKLEVRRLSNSQLDRDVEEAFREYRSELKLQSQKEVILSLLQQITEKILSENLPDEEKEKINHLVRNCSTRLEMCMGSPCQEVVLEVSRLSDSMAGLTSVGSAEFNHLVSNFADIAGELAGISSIV